jgi:predicted ATP-grasp superfamily ATP-dependent carboligase
MANKDNEESLTLMKDIVIVTYGWCRVAYAALRCLSEHGVEVIVGGPEKTMMAGRSRFASGSFVYPSPYLDPVGFVDCIAEAAVQYNAGVYLPMHEEIIVVAQYRSRLPKHLLVPIASYDQIMTAYDKGLTMRHAEAQGIPTPKTLYPDSVQAVRELAQNLTYPAMIKLRKSNSAKGVFKVAAPEELVSHYGKIVREFHVDKDSLPLIQEHLSGTVYAVAMLFNHGKLRSKFVRRNLREKTYGGGTCTKCVSVKNPTLERYAEKLLTTLDWHGVAMMEFKYDEKSDKAYLLEINPRYQGTIDHDIQSGVPTPYLQYRIAIDGDVTPVLDYRLGFTSRWLIGDMIGILDHMAKSSGLRERLRFLGSILKFDEDSYMDLKRDDLRPFFAEVWFYLSKFLRTGSRNPIDEGMVG